MIVLSISKERHNEIFGSMRPVARPMPKRDVSKRSALPCPQIISDISEYHSPIDGRPITTRSQRRDDLKRNGCVEYEPSLVPITREKGKAVFKNKRFAEKHNLQLHEAYR